jgi:hypothetical protein
MGETFLYSPPKLTVSIILPAVRFLASLLSYFNCSRKTARVERLQRLLRQTLRLAREPAPLRFNALNTISSLVHSDVER